MIRKDVIIAVLITFCLTATLFLSIPSHSNPSGYDPWADINCNGNVDIYDAILLANAFNTQGAPIDKSQYALPGAMSKPAYDSGWQYIAQDAYITLDHKLNTTDALVYMIGRVNQSASPYINQIDYGGEINYNWHTGAYWYDLTSTSIRIHRRVDDTNWDQVRIMMWKIP